MQNAKVGTARGTGKSTELGLAGVAKLLVGTVVFSAVVTAVFSVVVRTAAEMLALA